MLTSSFHHLPVGAGVVGWLVVALVAAAESNHNNFVSSDIYNR